MGMGIVRGQKSYQSLVGPKHHQVYTYPKKFILAPLVQKCGLAPQLAATLFTKFHYDLSDIPQFKEK